MDESAAPDHVTQLFARWRDAGDRAALTTLVEALRAPAFRVARAVLGSEGDPEDAVQEALMRIMTHARHWRGQSSARGWVLTVVANCARMQRRSLRARRRHERMAPALSVAADAHAGAGVDVDALLAPLDRRQRTLVWLHLVEGVSCNDLGAAAGTPAGTVRSCITRALGRVRDRAALDPERAGMLALAPMLQTPVGLDKRLAAAASGSVPVHGSGFAVARWLATAALVSTIVVATAMRILPHRLAPLPAVATDSGVSVSVSGDSGTGSATGDPESADGANALDAVIAPVFYHRPLTQALVLLDRELPPGQRLQAALTGLQLPHHWTGVTCTEGAPRPLRAILDDLCQQAGCRWHEYGGVAVIDQPCDAALRTQWEAALRDPTTDTLHREQAVAALASCGDLAGLRAVLIAAGDDHATVRACAMAAMSTTNSFEWVEDHASIGAYDSWHEQLQEWRTPLVAFRGDHAVADALAHAVAMAADGTYAERQFRTTLVRMCGCVRCSGALTTIAAQASLAPPATDDADGVERAAAALSSWCDLDDQASARLVAPARWEKRPGMREAMAHLRGRAASAALSVLIGDATADVQTRVCAVRALDFAPPQQRTTTALCALLGDSHADPELRANAAETLGCQRDLSAVPTLLHTLASEPLEDDLDPVQNAGQIHRRPTTAILVALATIHDRRAVPGVLAVVDHVGANLAGVHTTALSTLIALHDPATVPMLIARWDQRAQPVEMIFEGNLVPGPQCWLRLLGHCDSADARAALWAIVDAAAPLTSKPSLHNPADVALDEAWQDLAATHRPEVVHRLLDLVSAKNPQLRHWAWKLLWSTRDTAAVAAALAHAHDPCGPYEQRALDNLPFDLDAGSLAPDLLALLMRETLTAVPNPAVMQALARLPLYQSVLPPIGLGWAASNLPPDSLDAVLRTLTQSPDPVIRGTLIALLPWHGLPRTTERIVAGVLDRLAHDPEPSIRAAAAHRMSQVQDWQTPLWVIRVIVPPMLTALGDPDPRVRTAIWSELDKLATCHPEQALAIRAALALSPAPAAAESGGTSPAHGNF